MHKTTGMVIVSLFMFHTTIKAETPAFFQNPVKRFECKESAPTEKLLNNERVLRIILEMRSLIATIYDLEIASGPKSFQAITKELIHSEWATIFKDVFVYNQRGFCTKRTLYYWKGGDSVEATSISVTYNEKDSINGVIWQENDSTGTVVKLYTVHINYEAGSSKKTGCMYLFDDVLHDTVNLTIQFDEAYYMTDLESVFSSSKKANSITCRHSDSLPGDTLLKVTLEETRKIFDPSANEYANYEKVGFGYNQYWHPSAETLFVWANDAWTQIARKKFTWIYKPYGYTYEILKEKSVNNQLVFDKNIILDYNEPENVKTTTVMTFDAQTWKNESKTVASYGVGAFADTTECYQWINNNWQLWRIIYCEEVPISIVSPYKKNTHAENAIITLSGKGKHKKIRFFLKNASQVSVALYTIQGRRIATPLESKLLPAGNHCVPLHTNAWPGSSGAYFYQITIDNRHQSGNILLH